MTTIDGTPVRIREAEEDDAAALVRYLEQVGAESQFLTFGEEGVAIPDYVERAYIARIRAMSNGLFLVADADGVIVGALTFEGGERSRIRHVGEFGVSVARALWGRGIANALIERLIDWAIRGGVVRKLNLRVRVDNARAIALYERLGFRVEGRVTRDLLIDGVFHDSLWMGRAVDPAS